MRAIAWTVLLLLLVGAERRWGNRSAPVQVRESARESDQVMILSSVLALLAPILQTLVWPVRVTPLELGFGATVCVWGIFVRVAAMKTLRGRYRLTPAEQPDLPSLVSDGCYGVVRHPGYAGLLLTFWGLALIVGGWWASGWMLPMLLLLMARVRIEEELLGAEFAAAHTAYRSAVRWRIVPYVY